MMENSDPCYCIGHGCGVIKALFRQSIPMLDAIGGIHHTWGPMKKPKNVYCLHVMKAQLFMLFHPANPDEHCLNRG